MRPRPLPALAPPTRFEGAELGGPLAPPPPPQHLPSPPFQSPPAAQPGPSGGPGTPPSSSDGDAPPGDDADGDTEDELRGVTPAPPEDDPYGGTTDENTDDEEEPVPPLPDFFEDKTFFLYGDFEAPERRLLQRYVTAFGG